MEIKYKGYDVSFFGSYVNIYKNNELLFKTKADNFIWTEEAILALVDLYIKFEEL